eukprot:gene9669-13019_t
MSHTSEDNIVEFSIEFIQKDHFKQAYYRNNRACGYKNLRCFPTCLANRHVERHFCGGPLHITLNIIEKSAANGIMICNQNYLDSMLVLAEFKIVDDEYAIMNPIVGQELINSKLKSKSNPTNPCFVGKIVAVEPLIKTDHGIIHKCAVLFNAECKGWNYSWIGNRYKTVEHVISVTVLTRQLAKTGSFNLLDNTSNLLLQDFKSMTFVPRAHFDSPSFQVLSLRHKSSQSVDDPKLLSQPGNAISEDDGSDVDGSDDIEAIQDISHPSSLGISGSTEIKAYDVNSVDVVQDAAMLLSSFPSSVDHEFFNDFKVSSSKSSILTKSNKKLKSKANQYFATNAISHAIHTNQNEVGNLSTLMGLDADIFLDLWIEPSFHEKLRCHGHYFSSGYPPYSINEIPKESMIEPCMSYKKNPCDNNNSYYVESDQIRKKIKTDGKHNLDNSKSINYQQNLKVGKSTSKTTLTLSKVAKFYKMIMSDKDQLLLDMINNYIENPSIPAIHLIPGGISGGISISHLLSISQKLSEIKPTHPKLQDNKAIKINESAIDILAGVVDCLYNENISDSIPPYNSSANSITNSQISCVNCHSAMENNEHFCKFCESSKSPPEYNQQYYTQDTKKIEINNIDFNQDYLNNNHTNTLKNQLLGPSFLTSSKFNQLSSNALGQSPQLTMMSGAFTHTS